MGKLIKQAGEAAKVKVRHARKGAVDQTKDLPSEDDQKKAEKQVGSGACSSVDRFVQLCLRCLIS